MNNIMKFSVDTYESKYAANNDLKKKARDLVTLGKALTHYYMYENSVVPSEKAKFSEAQSLFSSRKSFATEEDSNFKIAMHRYAFEATGHKDHFHEDFLDNENSFKSMKNTMWVDQRIGRMLFNIEMEILDQIDSIEVVQDALRFAEVRSVAQGDSISFEIGSPGLYQVSQTSRISNGGRAQSKENNSVTLSPVKYEATIQTDRYQLMTRTFNFGKHMAKLARSFMALRYKQIIDAIYLVSGFNTNLTVGSFTKRAYIDLAQRVAAANGTATAEAYGTWSAFATIADTLITNNAFGFTENGSYLRDGYIPGLHGVNTNIIGQAIDTFSSTLAFEVPNDRIILMSPMVDKPIKVAMETETEVIFDEGRSNGNRAMVYTLQKGWAVGRATQSQPGILTI